MEQEFKQKEFRIRRSILQKEKDLDLWKIDQQVGRILDELNLLEKRILQVFYESLEFLTIEGEVELLEEDRLKIKQRYADLLAKLEEEYSDFDVYTTGERQLATRIDGRTRQGRALLKTK